MRLYISLLNDWAVCVYGIILSASFSGLLKGRRNWYIFGSCMILLPLLQGLLYSIWDGDVLRKLYPLIMHLPLMLILCIQSKKVLWSVISVLFGYLCCQLRRWLALLVVAIAMGGPVLQDVLELMLTVPLILLLHRFVAPAICNISHQSIKTQLHYGLIPIVFYIFDYTTVVYTDLLFSGASVIVEFMPFVCCVSYLVFMLCHSQQTQKQSHLQQIQKSLDIQLGQSVQQINALRESQELARQYRHDMRHHLRYVSACIENGQQQQAQAYILEICKEIDAQKVERFCENEAANLILSAFAGRIKNDGIILNVRAVLPVCIKVPDSDLCVVLSNALENAVHGCQALSADKERVIDLQLYEKENKLFLQVLNPCTGNISFENGIPMSDKPGHGIGVQSICAIVKRYGGLYSFSVENGQFVLRLCI